MGSSPAERYAAARALAKHEATRLARFEAQYDFPLDDFFALRKIYKTYKI